MSDTENLHFKKFCISCLMLFHIAELIGHIAEAVFLVGFGTDDSLLFQANFCLLTFGETSFQKMTEKAGKMFGHQPDEAASRNAQENAKKLNEHYKITARVLDVFQGRDVWNHEPQAKGNHSQFSIKVGVV